MRVFILQKGGRYDISSAKRYGRIVYLSDKMDPFKPTENVSKIRTELRNYKFDTKNDVICLTGPSILVAQLLAVVCNDFKKVKLLMFNAACSAYRLEIIDVR